MLNTKIRTLTIFLFLFFVTGFSQNSHSQTDCSFDSEAAREAYDMFIIQPALDALYRADEALRYGCEFDNPHTAGFIDTIYQAIDIYRETGDCSMFRFLTITLDDISEQVKQCEEDYHRREEEERERERQEYENQIQENYDRAQNRAQNFQRQVENLAVFLDEEPIVVMLERAVNTSNNDFDSSDIRNLLRELERWMHELGDLESTRASIIEQAQSTVMYSEGDFYFPEVQSLNTRFYTLYSEAQELLRQKEEEEMYENDQGNGHDSDNNDGSQNNGDDPSGDNGNNENNDNTGDDNSGDDPDIITPVEPRPVELTNAEIRQIARSLMQTAKAAGKLEIQNAKKERKELIGAAKSEAKSLRNSAKTQARNIILGAKAEAKQVRLNARGQSKAVRRAAHQRAKEIMADAKARARTLRVNANNEAKAILASAKSEGKALIVEARETRKTLIANAKARIQEIKENRHL